jgi:NADPH2:quinone reductase
VAPHDHKLRDKNMMSIGTRLPAVLAGDLVGTVVKTGADVASSFPIGAQIFAQMSFKVATDGGLQHYTVINGSYAAIVPLGISATEAALYPINAFTSAMALFTPSGLGIPFPGTPESAAFDYASQKVVIIGGGSNTGKLAVQLGRIAGIGTIIAVASLSNTAILKDFGATHVIARQDPDIDSQVRQIVGDELVYVYDAVSAGDYSLAVSILSNTKRGSLVHLVRGGVDKDLLAQKKAGVDDKHIVGFSGAIPEFGKLFWKVFPTWLESGQVKPLPYTVIEGLDADKVNAALDQYRDGKGSERFHVKLDA